MMSAEAIEAAAREIEDVEYYATDYRERVVAILTRHFPPVAAGEREAIKAAVVEGELLAALEALADDHEFGATGTVRQDHLRAAREAIANARAAAPTVEAPEGGK